MSTPQEYGSMLLDVIGRMGMPVDTFMPVATMRSQWRLDQGKNDGFVEGIDWLVEQGYLKQGTSPTFCALTESGSSVIEKNKKIAV